MKASSLLDVLRSFEAAITTVTGGQAPADLKELRDLFQGHEADDVAALLKTLTKQRDLQGKGANSAALARLRGKLAALETLLRSPDAKKAADDLAKIGELLEGCSQNTVGEFVREAHQWFDDTNKPKPKVSKAPPKRKEKAPVLPSFSPAEYAALLRQSVRDNAQFDQLVERLRGDNKIKKPNMREVAQLFLGYELPKKKGRDDALDAIIEAQRVEARQDARGSVLDRLKPW